MKTKGFRLQVGNFLVILLCQNLLNCERDNQSVLNLLLVVIVLTVRDVRDPGSQIHRLCSNLFQEDRDPTPDLLTSATQEKDRNRDLVQDRGQALSLLLSSQSRLTDITITSVYYHHGVNFMRKKSIILHQDIEVLNETVVQKLRNELEK